MTWSNWAVSTALITLMALSVDIVTRAPRLQSLPLWLRVGAVVVAGCIASGCVAIYRARRQ